MVTPRPSPRSRHAMSTSTRAGDRNGADPAELGTHHGDSPSPRCAPPPAILITSFSSRRAPLESGTEPNRHPPPSRRVRDSLFSRWRDRWGPRPVSELKNLVASPGGPPPRLKNQPNQKKHKNPQDGHGPPVESVGTRRHRSALLRPRRPSEIQLPRGGSGPQRTLPPYSTLCGIRQAPPSHGSGPTPTHKCFWKSTHLPLPPSPAPSPALSRSHSRPHSRLPLPLPTSLPTPAPTPDSRLPTPAATPDSRCESRRESRLPLRVPARVPTPAASPGASPDSRCESRRESRLPLRVPTRVPTPAASPGASPDSRSESRRESRLPQRVPARVPTPAASPDSRILFFILLPVPTPESVPNKSRISPE
jgi:hypothetical protein